MPSVQPIVVSYSELDAFRQCPHKHDLAHRQGWTPDKVGPALTKGRLYHLVLQLHYELIREGVGTKARRQAITDLLVDSIEEYTEETCELIAWMYDGYEDMWGEDSDWVIISVEDQRLCRLPDTSGRGSRFYLRMRTDLIMQERTVEVAGHRVNASRDPENKRFGKIWLVDHKSGKDLPTQRELDIDDQFGLYTWGIRKDGLRVFGALYNAGRTYRHKEERPVEERFSRTRLYRTDKELDNLAREAFLTARTAYTYESGDAPRAPDSDRCRWRCPFTEACLHGRKTTPNQEAIFLSSAGFTQMDEAERLAERGYENPLMPARTP